MNRDGRVLPEPVELVIFDGDGVLVDSERLAVGVEARLITELGWSVTEADVVDRFVGRSDSYMLGEIEANVGRSLPDWQGRYETALYAAQQMGALPSRCVVVEDSPSGVHAARAAGMRCVAYASGLIRVDRLQGPGTHVITDMSMLLTAIATEP